MTEKVRFNDFSRTLTHFPAISYESINSQEKLLSAKSVYLSNTGNTHAGNWPGTFRLAST